MGAPPRSAPARRLLAKLRTLLPIGPELVVTLALFPVAEHLVVQRRRERLGIDVAGARGGAEDPAGREDLGARRVQRAVRGEGGCARDR